VLINKKLSSQIDELISEAYDIGFYHGQAPFYIMKGKMPKCSNIGWGSVSKKLKKLLKEV
jgi:hypothetical protein